MRRGLVMASVWALAVLLTAGWAPPAGASSGSPLAPGDPVWAAFFDGPAHDWDGASVVAASPDGSKVFVTGYAGVSSGVADYATTAYDASTGSLLWSRRYDGPSHGNDLAHSLAVSPDGTKVFVTGESQRTSTNLDYATVAYDAGTGSPVWVRRYNGPGNANDQARWVAVSPDGTVVFVTGTSGGTGTQFDYATVAYDAGTGALRWGMRYNGPANQSDYAVAVAVSGDGSKVFVTGSSARVSLDLDWATVAYDAVSGGQLWSQRYNGPGNATDQPTSVASSPDGSRVFVTGTSGGAGTAFDYATVSFDSATGALLWTSRYDGPAHDTDEANSLAVSSDGSRVFVTGYSTGTTTGQDYATVAYDAATGSQQWVALHNGLNDWPDVAESIAASPDGTRVYVTGGTLREMGRFDYATVAYDAATGSELWGRRFDGPSGRTDFAYSVAVSPDGSKVFVTGGSAFGTTDWATVAYEA